MINIRPRSKTVTVGASPTAIGTILTRKIILKVVSGPVYLGGDDVSSANGIKLGSNEEITLGDIRVNGFDVDVDMSDVYLIGTGGQDCRVLYYEKAPPKV